MNVDLICRLATELKSLNARIGQIADEITKIVRPAPEPTIVGGLRIDLAAKLVVRDNVEFRLTKMECKLLTSLVAHVGEVLTHRFLLREVWGPETSSESQHLRVLVGSLRRKLEADASHPKYLLTERNGYRFTGGQ